MMTPLYLKTSGDTETILPVTINLEGKGLALFEINGSYQTDYTGPMYLCCDVVDPSIVGNMLLPVLRQLQMVVPASIKKKRLGQSVPRRLKQEEDRQTPVWRINEMFAKPIYVSCLRKEVTNFRLYLLGKDGNTPSLVKCRLNCTLLPAWNKYSSKGWQ